MNRILLISGGLLIAIYMSIRFHFKSETDLIRLHGLVGYFYFYEGLGLLIALAGIINKLWINIICLFFSSVFLVVNTRYFILDIGNSIGSLIRITGFALAIIGTISGILKFMKRKKAIRIKATPFTRIKLQ